MRYDNQQDSIPNATKIRQFKKIHLILNLRKVKKNNFWSVSVFHWEGSLDAAALIIAKAGHVGQGQKFAIENNFHLT